MNIQRELHEVIRKTLMLRPFEQRKKELRREMFEIDKKNKEKKDK
jgi:hypothetical protein